MPSDTRAEAPPADRGHPARRPTGAEASADADAAADADAGRTLGPAPAPAAVPRRSRTPRWQPDGLRLLRSTAVGLVVAAALAGRLVPTGTPIAGRPLWAVVHPDVLCGAGLAACALLALAGARRRRRDRAAWLAVATAQVCWALGELAWAIDGPRGDASPPVGPGDVGWGLSYVLAAVGLVALVRTHVDRLRPSPLLDALTAGLAVAAAGATWQLGHLVEDAEAGRLALAVNLAYPAADLLLVCLAVSSLGLTAWRLDRGWLWLAAGYAVAGVTDTAYALAVAEGRYVEGTPLDAGWLVAALALALACAPPADTDRLRPSGRRTALRVAMPALFTALALGVLVRAALAAEPWGRVEPVAIGLATAALVLVGIRLSVTFHQLHTLADGQKLARTDELTGLGNRRLLLERLDAALSDRAERADRAEPPRLALLIGDLDHFKVVNDTFGHPAGDRLLMEVSRRLVGCLRPGDLVCRLGGDEFAVLLPDGTRWRAEDLARRLRAAVAEPVVMDGTKVVVGLSLGIALAPEHSGEPAHLLQLADLAMYAAKRQGVGQRVFDVRQRRDAAAVLSPPDVSGGLRRALRNGELVVHYQPKVALAEGAPVGLEALVRWQHPERGVLHPPAFLVLPQVAEPERVREVTAVVLADALAACARWRSTGLSLPVAINVSAADLEDDELARRLVADLDRWRLPAGLVTLEVTETTLLRDPQRARRALQELRALGVRVSLDDYGTGFSSLTHLRDFPLDELKLDRTFVAALQEEPVTWAIVRSTIDLAHTLGLTVVAEGVERPADLFALRELGCDHGQGWLWSPALPPSDVLAWVAGRRLRPHDPAGAPSAAGRPGR